MIGQKGVKPDLYDVELGRGMLLLCSDGVSDAMDDAEMQAAVSRSVRLDEMCRRLVKAALTRGAKDNVTVVLASR